MSVHILVEPLNDESIFSLAARTCLINGYRSDLASRLLFGNENNLRVSDSKINFSVFDASTFGHYGNIKNILKLTNLNFRDVITTPLLDGRNSGKWHKLIDSNESIVSTMSNFDEHCWRWCEECFSEDLIKNGFTYWRLQNQLPGVFICTHHRSLLSVANIPFRLRQKHFFLSNSLPAGTSITKYTCNPGSFEMLAMLSNISKGIQNEIGLNQGAFRATIHHGLIAKGLVTRTNVISVNTTILFSFYFQNLHSIKDIQTILRPHIFSKTVKAFLFNHDIKTLYPTVIPMLILWLFNDWHTFMNAYRWVSVMGAQNYLVSINKTKTMQTDENFHREECKKFLIAFPNASRKDFWKLKPKSSRWLNSYDKNWFNKEFIKNRPFQLRLFNI